MTIILSILVLILIIWVWILTKKIRFYGDVVDSHCYLITQTNKEIRDDWMENFKFRMEVKKKLNI